MSEIEYVVEKLRAGEKFGLFDNHSKCYFQDGTRVHYQDLWKAIRIVNGIEEGKQCKRLADECPDNFVGMFAYKYEKHNWKKALVKQAAA